MIPRADLLQPSDTNSSPHLSPDAKSVLYQALDENKIMNVWVRPRDQKSGTQITHDHTGHLEDPQWQWDGKHILYALDNNGDENTHIYQLDVATKITRDLTPFVGAKAHIIALEPSMPDKMVVGMNARDPKYFDAYGVDLRSGAIELLAQNPGDVSGWSVDAKLQVREATAVLKDGTTEIRVRDSVESPWRVLTSWSSDEEGGFDGFDRDGRSVLVSTSADSNTVRVLRYDLLSGKSSVVAEDKDFDTRGVLRNPITHDLEAVKVIRDHGEWISVSDAAKSEYDALNKLNGDFNVYSRDITDRHWLVSLNSDVDVQTYYLYDRDAQTCTLFQRYSDILSKYHFVPTKSVQITARDGLVLRCYLTLPEGVGQKNLPTIVYVHGGPWARASWGFDRQAQLAANRGYAFISINYRGSTGFGKKFVNAGDKEWSKKMNDDVIDIKNWLVKEGIADPTRLAIYGHSYGGYEALTAAAFTPGEFTCAVDASGPSNLSTLLRALPPDWTTGKVLLFKRMGDPDKDQAFLESCSPLFKAQSINIPLLVAQGKNDPRVKESEAQSIVDAVRKNKREVTYLLFPDEGHGFDKPIDFAKFNAAKEVFLGKYLDGRVEPPSAEENYDSLLK